ncbi:MAG: hypothetical protein A3J74_11635 [Elusimicrobia bacterium RIFCSPHIGHO2_02_FULL_57_9]|nr:MAG: hypothetical protein A3J74_11635 [Elusimicrobia bacterium RIFCSPHIGHO2_02_FULL_57_9]
MARAAGGHLLAGDPDQPIEALSTDTRALKIGEAFWALKGPRFDAHDLLNEPLAQKASGWIIERDRFKARGFAPKHLIEVTNTLKALQAFSAHHRRRFEIPVVGITGSNGKTTTKEMLKCICSRFGPSCASPENWNNQIGVALSALQLSAEHHYGIFELGDCHPGDIDEVARICSPTLAVLTNIGPDHLEFYGSLEENFKAKSELIENLPEEGKAVINIDDPWLSGLEPRLGARAVTFGANPRARVNFPNQDEMIIDRHKIKLSLKTFGMLSRYNAAAAAAAAWALGIDPDTIRRGLEDYLPAAMRLELIKHASGCSIVLDAYNANPASMRAAIEAFCSEFAAGRKVLVLGDMKELGALSPQFHHELGTWLATLPLSSVYLAGPEMKSATEALKLKNANFAVHYALTPDSWLDELRTEFAPDRALFFKASRAMKFESILQSLQCSTT